MGNAKSKDELKELREKDMAERRLRQDEQKRRVLDEEEKRRNEVYKRLIILTLQAACRGFLMRKHYDTMKATAVRRSKIAAEILSTEVSYVNSLKLLIDKFYQPLLATALAEENRSTRSFSKRKNESFKTKEELSQYYKNGGDNGSNYGSASSAELMQSVGDLDSHNASSSSTPTQGSLRKNTSGKDENSKVYATRSNGGANGSPNGTLQNSSGMNSPGRKSSHYSMHPEAIDLSLAVEIPGITKEDVKGIFSQIQVICSYNENIAIEVEKRVGKWSWTQRLGDIFLQMTDFLKVYIQYVNNYNVALSIIEKLNQIPEFIEWRKKVEHIPECAGNTISSFLIMPIQRIPRYVMLLEDLHRCSPGNHIDHDDLEQALHKMKDVAKLINEKKREAENFEFLLNLYHRLEPTQDDLCEAHRRLVKEGLLKEDGNSFMVFLFNDILLITKEKGGKKLKVCHRIAMTTDTKIVSLIDDKTQKIKNTFQISVGEVTHTVKAKTPEEKDAWIKDMEEVVTELNKKASSFQTRDRKATLKEKELSAEK